MISSAPCLIRTPGVSATGSHHRAPAVSPTVELPPLLGSGMPFQGAIPRLNPVIASISRRRAAPSALIPLGAGLRISLGAIIGSPEILCPNHPWPPFDLPMVLAAVAVHPGSLPSPRPKSRFCPPCFPPALSSLLPPKPFESVDPPRGHGPPSPPALPLSQRRAREACLTRGA